MADNKLNLLVRFGLVDKLSAGLKSVVKGSQDGHRALAMMKATAKKLDGQLADVRKNLNSESRRSGLVLAERELQAAIADTNRQIERQTRLLAIDKSADKWAARGDAVTSFGQKATVALTGPIAVATGLALNASKIFDENLANIQSITGQTQTEIEKLGEKIKDIGNADGASANKLAETYYDIASAGYQGAESLEILRQSNRLAQTGLADTGQAASLMTSTLKAFNLEGSKAAQVADEIFTTIKKGKTTAAELESGFGDSASAIAAAGVKHDELFGIVAAATQTGVKANVVYTQMKSLTSSLLRNTKQTAAVYDGLGAKSLPDLIEKSGGFVKALQRIRSHLGNNDSKLLDLVGTVEGFNAALLLTGSQSSAFNDAFSAINNSGGSVDRAFAEKKSTDSGKTETAKAQIENAGIDAGGPILKVTATIAKSLGELAQSFSKLSPETQGFIIKSVAMAAALGPVSIVLGSVIKLAAGMAGTFSKLEETGKLAKRFSILKSGVIGMAKGFLTAGRFLLANPIFLVIAAIAGAAYLIYTNWDKIKAAFNGAIEYIGNLLSGLPSWSSLFEALYPQWLVDKVSEIWGNIKTKFWEGVDRVKTILSELPDKLKTIGLNLMSGLLDAINPFALADRLLTLAKNGIDAFKNFFGIKSPSRLMMEMGGYMSAGLSVGLDRSGKRPVQAMKRIATGVAGAGALALSPAAIAAPGSGSLQPAQTSRTAQAAAPVTININIYQQPGQDAQDLARQVADMIRRQRADLQRRSFTDDF